MFGYADLPCIFAEIDLVLQQAIVDAVRKEAIARRDTGGRYPVWQLKKELRQMTLHEDWIIRNAAVYSVSLPAVYKYLEQLTNLTELVHLSLRHREGDDTDKHNNLLCFVASVRLFSRQSGRVRGDTRARGSQQRRVVLQAIHLGTSRSRAEAKLLSLSPRRLLRRRPSPLFHDLLEATGLALCADLNAYTLE